MVQATLLASSLAAGSLQPAALSSVGLARTNGLPAATPVRLWQAAVWSSSPAVLCRSAVSVRRGSVEAPEPSHLMRKNSRGRPCAAAKEVVGSLFGTSLRFAVVVGRFNENVTRLLLAGALEAFTRYGVAVEDVEVVWVPGSFELPIVAQQMAKSAKFDAVLCIGAVIRGATTHYDAVAGAAASGVLTAGLNAEVPCIFGVLTTENPEQAFDRAGGKAGNKGAEAAITAIEMANLMKTLRESGSAA